MKVRKSIVLVAVWILTATVFFVFPGAEVAPVVKGNTITVPDNYTTIQAAIDNASAGDTVYISNGTYSEHIVIDKPLHLLGSGVSSTTYLNVSTGWAITISADNVTIEGIVISGNGTAAGGIRTKPGGVFNNITIKNCVIQNFTRSGILLSGSASSYGNNYQIDSVVVRDVKNTTINGTGIVFIKLNGTLLNGSRIYDTDLALLMNSTVNFTVKNNRFTNNNIGIAMRGSSNNLIYNNYFDNSVENYNVTGGTGNRWNITKTSGTNIIGGDYLGGNYWSDYTGKDTDGDWLGDTNVPYGPGDSLPLAYDTIPPRITDSTTDSPTTGESFTFNATVTDERGVYGVWVEYWYGTSGTHYNVSMTNVGGNQWDYTITVADTLDTLHYIFHANDT
ncbi:MAG: right-handed parallel beta-helix repeat-containing protein, partial [Thermoplasmata archaeon]|nr:right-handed parallel beta-helix repeat-containing protein [Thermoplasmata archaeon]